MLRLQPPTTTIHLLTLTILAATAASATDQHTSSVHDLTNGHGTSNEEETSLIEFRELTQTLAYREFMKADSYLLGWLKNTDFDVEEALANFERFINWRRPERVDWIIFEDFSSLDKEHPFSFDTFDKAGRPVNWVPFGSYDIRATVLAHGQTIYRRYMLRIFELMEFYLSELRMTANATHKHSQYIGIYDLAGFNLKSSVCFKCVTLIPDIVSDFQKYPTLFHKLFVINTPKMAHAGLNLAQSLMSDRVRDIMNIFGYDKSDWVRALHEQIDLDALPVEYGGSLPSFRSKSAKEERMAVLEGLLERAKESVLRDMGHNHRHHHHESLPLAPTPPPAQLEQKNRMEAREAQRSIALKSNGWKPSSTSVMLAPGSCVLIFELICVILIWP